MARFAGAHKQVVILLMQVTFDQCPLSSSSTFAIYSISVVLLFPSCLQLVAAMIRKHLSWLIVWGNLFGALLGLVAEIIVIVFSVTST